MGSLIVEPKTQKLEDDVKVIVPSAEERQQGTLSPLSLTRALEALHQDGLVVLRGVIDVEHVDALNDKMCKDADVRLADPNQEFNHAVRSNFLQRPPITDPQYLYKDVYFNSFLLQVANAYLGHRPIWNWLTANTAMSGTAGMRQLAHKDCAFDNPMFPYYFIANIPLCDFTVENGATEFWLGSHAHTTGRDNVVATEELIKINKYGRVGEPLPAISEAAKEARMKIRPPIQPAAQRGDIMIRDLRTWHAGMPNSSSRHRIMLGLGYMSRAHPNYNMRLHLPKAQQNFFLSNALDQVEVRANMYTDEEMETLTIDSYFNLRPDYLD